MAPARKDDHHDALFGRESLFRQKLNELRTTGQLSQMRKAVTQARTRELEQLGYLQNARESLVHSDPKELERITLLDSLTEFYNHSTISRIINDEFKRCKRYKRPLTVLAITVDRLDEIEAAYTKIVADSVLKGVAAFVMKEIREVDIPGRYDARTLLVVCPETDAPGVTVLAERIRAKIKLERVSDAAQNWFVTVSEGIASFPQHAKKAEDLLVFATSAMRAAGHGQGDAVELAR